MTADLSILIPARNEMFLGKTVQNILENIEGKTEIIAVLDGYTVPVPELPDDPRLTIINLPNSIGQRAGTNAAAHLSRAKYLMKCDAHCAFDKGFDIKMIREMHDDWTMVPLMRNLHAFDWLCPNGHRRYQGPSGPCTECGKETVRDILWRAKEHPRSTSYCFDSTPHFQYFNEYTRRPESQGEITETMSLQGSCFMMTRDKYWELEICDEKFGSWGSQGIEVAVKTWLSGGRVMVNKKTWYAHMFRTQGGDFSFPYPISGRDQENAKKFAKDLFFNNNWSKQIHPLSWLIEKFWPVKGWTQEDLDKLKANTFKFKDVSPDHKPVESEPLADEVPAGNVIFQKSVPSRSFRQSGPTREIIYYTDHKIRLKLGHLVQDVLKQISSDRHIPIVSASIKKMTFGDKDIQIKDPKGDYIDRLRLILGALEASTAEIVFLCEKNVLYHPSHFDFIPMRNNLFYYNQNWWKMRTTDGLSVHWDGNQTSGLVAYRELLLKFYRDALSQNKTDFEPGRDNPELAEAWKSEYPNIDIRIGENFIDGLSFRDFGSKTDEKNFMTAMEIPGWGKTKDLIVKL